MDIDTFTETLERMMERVPPAVLRDLNGGVGVAASARRRQEDPHGVWILGEYIRSPQMGARVMLYYGSFAAVLGGAGDAAWERQLWDTLRHELRHHVEHLAGIDDLGAEDEAQLERMRRDLGGGGRLRFNGRLPRRGDPSVGG